jgi:hypothetical protein
VSDIDLTEYEPQIVTGDGRYAITDNGGLVANVILWDGATPYDPGDGLDLIALEPDSPVQPGDTIAVRKGGKVAVVARAEPVEPEPTVEDRIAALEEKLAR